MTCAGKDLDQVLKVFHRLDLGKESCKLSTIHLTTKQVRSGKDACSLLPVTCAHHEVGVEALLFLDQEVDDHDILATNYLADVPFD
jgi:hypothetical protein